jgi:hypothetical protein
MGLADALAAPVVAHRAPCHVAVLLSALPAADREGLRAALADPARPSTWIAAVLRANGHDVSAGSVQRHRRGGCRCR